MIIFHSEDETSRLMSYLPIMKDLKYRISPGKKKISLISITEMSLWLDTLLATEFSTLLLILQEGGLQ